MRNAKVLKKQMKNSVFWSVVRWLLGGQGGQKTLQDGHKTPQEVAKTLHDGPKTPQDGPKMRPYLTSFGDFSQIFKRWKIREASAASERASVASEASGAIRLSQVP